MNNCLLRYKGFIREMILYGFIGGFAATTDSIVFYLMIAKTDMYISNFTSINIGITLSFFLNTFVNFKKTDKLVIRAMSFYAVGYIGLLLSMVLLFVGVYWLNFDKMPVKISSIFMVASLQFLLNKLVTFRSID